MEIYLAVKLYLTFKNFVGPMMIFCLTSQPVPVQLICIFVFLYENSRFSHDMVHLCAFVLVSPREDLSRVHGYKV